MAIYEDLYLKQIHSIEQVSVLTNLAKSVAKPGCLFLEVGSWCGDSALILGGVAKQSGGILICIDWWKGNSGTPLEGVAENQDIYNIFWRRIVDAGLQDYIVPIRARSDIAGEVLRQNSFDFIFIDADHRYASLKKDISLYKHCLKSQGGIISGHDCEGFLSDFDADFLNSGKNTDIYESIHCGVTLAVSETFPHFSLMHNIWSVMSTNDGWVPTSIEHPGISNKPRTSVAPFAHNEEYSISRIGRNLYVVPKLMSNIDLTKASSLDSEYVLKFSNLEEAEAAIGMQFFALPLFCRRYGNFNIVFFRNYFYGVHCSSSIDCLLVLNEQQIQAGILDGILARETSIEALITILSNILENYLLNNISAEDGGSVYSNLQAQLKNSERIVELESALEKTSKLASERIVELESALEKTSKLASERIVELESALEKTSKLASERIVELESALENTSKLSR